jgi:hypothetical protein
MVRFEVLVRLRSSFLHFFFDGILLAGLGSTCDVRIKGDMNL